MKDSKFLWGILSGAIGGAAIGGFLMYHFVVTDKYEFGKNQGFAAGGLNTIRFLDKHFHNDSPEDEGIIDVLHFKDSSIFVREKSGILTIETQ